MKDIKFRCWDEDHLEWHNGRDFLLSLDGEVLFNLGYGGLSKCDYRCGAQVVCQFTEVQDKNKLDIYEGDILRWSHDSVSHTIVKVEYICNQDKNGFFIVDGSYTRPLAGHVAEKCEVIGNIFQNPDLIKP
jgi:uncharacterized phage protein (TIGR01671 family)